MSTTTPVAETFAVTERIRFALGRYIDSIAPGDIEGYQLDAQQMRDLAATFLDLAKLRDISEGATECPRDLLADHVEAINDLRLALRSDLGAHTYHRQIRAEGDESYGYGGTLEEDLAKFDAEATRQVDEMLGLRELLLAVDPTRIVL